MSAANGAFHVVLLAPLCDATGRVIDARIEFADDAWRRKLAAGADPTGHSLRRYLGDDTTRLDAIGRTLEIGSTIQTEFRHPTSPERVAEVLLTPLDGRVIATGREVTEDRALREDLARSRAELIAAQKLASMGSWLWDPQSDRAEWSDTMLRIYGLAPGTPAPSFAEQRRFYDAETLARTSILLERVLRTGEPYSIEYDVLRDDGQRRHVIAHGESVVVDGSFAGLRGTVVDITELHQAREALARSERRLATVLDAIHESVAILEPERSVDGEATRLRIEWVNPGWHSLWRIDGEVVGRDVYDLNPALGRYRALHRDLLDHGGAGEVSVQRADGGLVEATVVAMGDRLLEVGRDVTDARRAQELGHDRRRAEQIVALAGGIAHQFNNALMAIIGHAEELSHTLDGEVRCSADAILEASQHAATLTRQLLAYAQRQPLRPADFELQPHIMGLVPALRGVAGDAIELRLELAGERVWVSFDPDQLRLVLLELVRDGRRAMPQGGTITLSVARSAPFALLSVADTGPGIAADQLPRVFDPFVTGIDADGTGLGLSSVHGTMAQSGGRITVQSEPGHGRVFTLTLPLATPLEAASIEPPSRAPTPATVLVVDDEPLVRRAVARSLRGIGYTVIEASSGEEALGVLSKTEVDVLLTDVTMPHLSGRELAERAGSIHPRMPVVFMSGYAESFLEADGSLPPGARFVAKPFRSAVLCEVVERALRERMSA
ncbi:MAG: response regulator [Sandaracinus sp.]